MGKIGVVTFITNGDGGSISISICTEGSANSKFVTELYQNL